MLVARQYVLFKRSFFSILLFFVSSFIFSQEKNIENNRGIVFTSESNWQAVLNKAKKENKYIFVDAFTTWCAPCKAMTTQTFTDSSVGDYVNNKFVAVKLQMDTSKTDNDHVKAWYADAKLIEERYKINAYPTVLFFNANGKLVHKAIGYQFPRELEDIVREATDPSKQPYTLLEQYNVGKLNIDAYPGLARKLKEIKEKKLANEIAEKYIATLKNENIYIKENLVFIREFFTSTKGKIFDVFYKNQKKVDEIMGTPFYSQDFVDYLISKENIYDPYLLSASKEKNVADLDWDKMYRTINKKYGPNYANRIIAAAKMRWYDIKEQWPEYIANKIKYTEVYDRPESRERVDGYYSIDLNNNAWAIFEHSNDPEQLKIALKWSKLVNDKLPNDAVCLDTYANLLYKLGRKEEAIPLEEKALSLAPDNEDIKQALEKMKSGLPTWPQ